MAKTKRTTSRSARPRKMQVSQPLLGNMPNYDAVEAAIKSLYGSTKAGKPVREAFAQLKQQGATEADLVANEGISRAVQYVAFIGQRADLDKAEITRVRKAFQSKPMGELSFEYGLSGDPAVPQATAEATDRGAGDDPVANETEAGLLPSTDLAEMQAEAQSLAEGIRRDAEGLEADGQAMGGDYLEMLSQATAGPVASAEAMQTRINALRWLRGELDKSLPNPTTMAEDVQTVAAQFDNAAVDNAVPEAEAEDAALDEAATATDAEDGMVEETAAEDANAGAGGTPPPQSAPPPDPSRAAIDDLNKKFLEIERQMRAEQAARQAAEDRLRQAEARFNQTNQTTEVVENEPVAGSQWTPQWAKRAAPFAKATKDFVANKGRSLAYELGTGYLATDAALSLPFMAGKGSILKGAFPITQAIFGLNKDSLDEDEAPPIDPRLLAPVTEQAPPQPNMSSPQAGQAMPETSSSVPQRFQAPAIGDALMEYNRQFQQYSYPPPRPNPNFIR